MGSDVRISEAKMKQPRKNFKTAIHRLGNPYFGVTQGE